MFIAPVSGDQSYLRSWQDHTPLVFPDSSQGNLSADSVVSDDQAEACTATAHLIQHGHRRIAFVGNTTSLVTTLKRLDARLLSFGYPSTADAIADVSRLLALPDLPAALFDRSEHLTTSGPRRCTHCRAARRARIG
ncbi:MAG: type 1 periplasmic-binding domain-containing protein [Lacisediminihabitans sp.]